MIVLDTNVLSEFMRGQPEPAVVRWLDLHSQHEYAITAVTVAELLYGIARLPEGRRKGGLQEAALQMIEDEFAGMVLPFDEHTARHYAAVVAQRERSGRPVSMADAQIAAICRHHGAVLATRNGKDFEGIGLSLANPWLE